MPILSDRKLFLRELEDVLRTLAQFDEDGSSDFEEILDIKARLEETRYFNLREHHEKNHSTTGQFLNSREKNRPTNSRLQRYEIL